MCAAVATPPRSAAIREAALLAVLRRRRAEAVVLDLADVSRSVTALVYAKGVLAGQPRAWTSHLARAVPSDVVDGLMRDVDRTKREQLHAGSDLPVALDAR